MEDPTSNEHTLQPTARVFETSSRSAVSMCHPRSLFSQQSHLKIFQITSCKINNNILCPTLIFKLSVFDNGVLWRLLSVCCWKKSPRICTILKRMQYHQLNINRICIFILCHHCQCNIFSATSGEMTFPS